MREFNTERSIDLAEIRLKSITLTINYKGDNLVNRILLKLQQILKQSCRKKVLFVMKRSKDYSLFNNVCCKG